METDENRAPLRSVVILLRARPDGYDDGKTRLYELAVEAVGQRCGGPLVDDPLNNVEAP